MKKLLIVLGIFFVLGVMGNLESTYTRQGTVVDSNTIECTKGYLWECDTTGFEQGQMVTMVMNDNHTSTIKDDIVKSIK